MTDEKTTSAGEVKDKPEKTLAEERAELAAHGITGHSGIMTDLGRICRRVIGDNTERFLILNVDNCFLGDTGVELKTPLSPKVGSASFADNKDVTAPIEDLEKVKKEKYIVVVTHSNAPPVEGFVFFTFFLER